jgi:eukaryotic-like serine/threonine-protein kinase
MQEGSLLRNNYRLDRLLGRGGMADVYLAFDISRQAHVAVKILREDLAEDPEFVRRFAREAEALAKLNHPNVVRFYSFERQGATAFIVMDYVPGTTLQRRRIEAGAPPPLSEVTRILRQIGAALQYAHSEGYVHRDVKPGNIMLREDGKALLSDFGIARAAESATLTTATLGTPAYMSPEQILGRELDRRTDIYSLGVVLFEMATGRRPFTGDERGVTGTSTLARLREAHLKLAPPPPQAINPLLPAGLGAVISRALAKEVDDRWPDVVSLMQAWEVAAGSGEATVVMPATGALAGVAQRVATSPAEAAYPRDTMPSSAGPAVPASVMPASIAPANATPADRKARQPAGQNRFLLPALLGTVAVVVGLLAVLLVKLLTGGGSTASEVAARATSTPGPQRTVAILVMPAPSSTLAPTPIRAVLLPTEPPAPTATRTAEPTDTATPAPTARPQVVIQGDTINIRSGPGTAYNVVGQASQGTVYNVVARTAAGDWFRLEGDQERWVAAQLVQVAGEVPVASRLPAAPAAPAGGLVAPTLISPVDGYTLWPRNNEVFQWRWTGRPLGPNEGFEVRMWKEGSADHPGVAPPIPYVADRNHIYALEVGSIRSTPGVNYIPTDAWINVYWTVAVVQINPYRRTGPEAKPFLIRT